LAPACRVTSGLPEGWWMVSIWQGATPCLKPVPSALETASLAAESSGRVTSGL
jgi:hypothetical protein